MDEKNSEYIGKEMYGFRFSDAERVGYSAKMDNFVGEIGKIVNVDSDLNAVTVKFDSNSNHWWYPLHLVNDNLLENEQSLTLDELFYKISKLC